MKLEEAIKHLEESLADQSHDWGCKECKGEHEQLLKWLRELKELREENINFKNEIERLRDSVDNLVYNGELDFVELKEAKRLLKVAVEDINYYVDCYEAHCDECCCDHDNHCHWKHEAEALALIGKEGDTE